MIRVLLVDDQELIRLGFRMILEDATDIEVVGEAGNGRRAVEMCALVKPDVVLMDVQMPDVDGIAATASISRLDRAPRVLILTTFDLDEYVFAGLRAGASGFMLKDVPPDKLLDAIRTVAGGDSVLAPTATKRLLDKFGHLFTTTTQTAKRDAVLGTLTAREIEVFDQLATGASNQQIAAALFLSEHTVKIHVSHVLAKLDLRDRVQRIGPIQPQRRQTVIVDIAAQREEGADGLGCGLRSHEVARSYVHR